ncbi:MAG TPA: ribonuclease HII [Thermodesulfobacteriota bacterium]|nr:ribonuclease HII [Thermodesulfobacteriota bacterium]
MKWEPFEETARKRGFQFIAGLDEAGRGPLAGPVVAAAVVFPKTRSLKGIDDSKVLSAGQREKALSLLQRRALGVGIGIVEAGEIDRINILQASLKAMELAVQSLPLRPDFLLIDGLHCLKLPVEQKAIPKGDRRCLSIAAASIVAKVTRDRLMVAYHQDYPEYNFAQHKGYGTREHLQAIQKYGCCPLHRQSFKKTHQLPLL